MTKPNGKAKRCCLCDTRFSPQNGRVRGVANWSGMQRGSGFAIRDRVVSRCQACEKATKGKRLFNMRDARKFIDKLIWGEQ